MATIEKANAEQLSTILIFLREYIEGGHSDKAVTLRMYTHADAASIKQAGDIFRKALETG